MDDYVKNKLKNYGLEKYIEAFEENKIDELSSKLLNDEVIRSIFTKGGPRSIFLTKWKEEFEGKKMNDSVDGQSNILQPPENSDTEKIQPEVYNFERFDNLQLMLQITSPETNVIDVLQKSIQGIAILAHYKDHHDLTSDQRGILAEIIVGEEIRSSSSLNIRPSRLDELSRLIAETFPTEKKEIYYIPSTTNKVSKKTIFVKGKLHDKHATLRGLLLGNHLTESMKTKKRKYIDVSSECRMICLGFREFFSKEEVTEAEKKVMHDKIN
ncbi:hypothetical protein TKK_0005104 [Trichogramma kaykai]